MTLQVVWFKRDLRLTDHRPLIEASQRGPVLCVYVLEDEYWQLAETSNRQWLFVRDSLIDLQQQLAVLGGNLLVLRSSLVAALSWLQHNLGSFALYSHEETGNLWTYQRDIRVADWCKQQQVRWRQYAQNGVRRPSRNQKTTTKNADAWQQHWQHWSQQPVLPVPATLHFADLNTLCHQAPAISGAIPTIVPVNQLPQQLCDDEFTCPGRQLGGRQNGLALLDSFLYQRSQRYQAAISSPLTAERGCSRLSAHLAYGTIGIREVLARLDVTLRQNPDRLWCRNLSAFRSRLVWHCYFIQKLESKPDAGQVNLNRKYDALVRPWDAVRFTAWRLGRTGWPLVDACMRYLIYHGWLNFRMRAMLVSVACYTLKLPWQPVSDYLATLFVDFEPGIHYPQIQMQSGTTGQQVLRIYNPVKQAQELDPEGIFVRRWLPELAQVSNVWIFEPWRMPDEMKLRCEAQGYPQPLVDFTLSHRQAKDEISLLRSGFAKITASGTRQAPAVSGTAKASGKNTKQAIGERLRQMPLFDE